MIITNITDIDCLAERVLTTQNNFISVDLEDYKALKRDSTSIKAATVKLAALDDDGLTPFAESLNEFDKGGAKKVILYIYGETATAESELITYDQVMGILRDVDAHFGEGKLVWGIAGDINPADGIEVHIFVGY